MTTNLSDKLNLLQFQEYPEFDSKDDNIPTNQQKLNGFIDNSPKRSFTFFNIDFYKQFFNVESIDVAQRIKYALLPTTKSTQLENIKINPDLYGPIWICITLVISLSMSDNLGKLVGNLNKNHKSAYYYDFGKMSSAALTIGLYAFLIPTIIYIYLRFKDNVTNLKFAELLCYYGYSLSIFIPATFACIINMGWLQWLTFAAAGILSFLAISEPLWIALSENQKMVKMILFASMGICECIFIFVLKHFFVN